MARAQIIDPPEHPLPAIEQRRRELAARLGCFTEAEVCELTGYSPGSLQTYRQRRTVLPFVRLGPEVLYPIAGVRKLMEGRTRHPHTEATVED